MQTEALIAGELAAWWEMPSAEQRSAARKGLAESRQWTHSVGLPQHSTQGSGSPTPARASRYHKTLLKHQGWSSQSPGV